MTDVPTHLCLRLYKNRSLTPIHGDLQQHWESSRWWEEVCGPLLRNKGKASLTYDDYTVYDLQMPEEDRCLQWTPTKACVLWRVNENAIQQHHAKMYDTVQAHAPVQPHHVGGHSMVAVSLSQTTQEVDISGLKKTVWKQLGQKGDSTIVLIKMTKQRDVDFVVAKDDVTGEVYPYRITQVLYLQQKAQTTTLNDDEWMDFIQQHPMTHTIQGERSYWRYEDCEQSALTIVHAHPQASLTDMQRVVGICYPHEVNITRLTEEAAAQEWASLSVSGTPTFHGSTWFYRPKHVWPHRITKQQFLLYREYQKKGEFNMMELSSRKPSLFSDNDVIYIIANYKQLMKDIQKI